MIRPQVMTVLINQESKSAENTW